MMQHYTQGQGYGGVGGVGDGQQQAQSPQPQDDSLNTGDGMRGHASINTILDQIMTITDQSLDEAQVFTLQWISAFSNSKNSHKMKNAIPLTRFHLK